MRRATWTMALGFSAALALSGCGDDAAPEGDETPTGEVPGEGTGAGVDGGTEQGEEEDPGSGAVPGTEGAAADLTVALQDGDGAEVGTVSLTDSGGSTEIRVEADGLPPGFHGLHIHAVGECEPDSQNPDNPEETGDFLSAGGHIGVDEADHGEHAGDLPSLYVEEAGSALLMTRTDAVSVDELLQDDGSALMVHSDRDNFARIPERYAPDGPDQDTLDTGDAGDRIACAVLTE